MTGEILQRRLSRRTCLAKATGLLAASTLAEVGADSLRQPDPFFCSERLFLSPEHQDHFPEFGFTFSLQQAELHGLNAKETYENLISRGFQWVRIAAYNNKALDEQHETLRWQIDLAKKHNVKIILGVGLGAPNYPERYPPLEGDPHDISVYNAGVILREFIDDIDLVQADNEIHHIFPYAHFLPHPEEYKQKLLAVVRMETSKVGKQVLINDFVELNEANRDTWARVLTDADVAGIDFYGQVYGVNFSCKDRKNQISDYVKRAEQEGKPWIITELQSRIWSSRDKNHKKESFTQRHREELYQQIMKYKPPVVLFWDLELAMRDARVGHPEQLFFFQSKLDARAQYVSKGGVVGEVIFSSDSQ